MQLVEEMGGLFAGGEMSEEDIDGVMPAMQDLYRKAKKDLLFLIPFHVFCYEKCFPDDKDKPVPLEDMEKMLSDFREIRNALDRKADSGAITELTKRIVVDMFIKVFRQVARKHTKEEKEVENVMGGKILEYEAKSIYKQGVQEGRKIAKDNAVQHYKQMVADGISTEKALQYSGLTREDVD